MLTLAPHSNCKLKLYTAAHMHAYGTSESRIVIAFAMWCCSKHLGIHLLYLLYLHLLIQQINKGPCACDVSIQNRKSENKYETQ